MGKYKNPPKKGTQKELQAYKDSLDLFNLSEKGLDIYKQGFSSVDDYFKLKENHEQSDAIANRSKYKPTAEMPQRTYELKDGELGNPNFPLGTKAIGYSQYIFKEPQQPIYRKFGGKLKYCKFGDFLNDTYKSLTGKADSITNGQFSKVGKTATDVGQFTLNAYTTPIEHITGRNFYDPKFNSHAIGEINNVTQGIEGAATDVAGNYFAGPAYGAIKSGVQAGVNMADPNRTLDNTSEANKNSTSFQVGQGISQVGGIVNSLSGTPDMGSMSNLKLMKNGGQLTRYTGAKHESGGIQIPGMEAEVEGNETLNNKSQYVYSDSIKIDDKLAEEFHLGNTKGKTFSKYSKKIDDKFAREDDRFDQKAKERMLDRLTEAQESFKMVNFADNVENKFKMKMGGSMYKKYAAGGPLKMEEFATKEGLDPYDPNTFNMYNAYLKDYNSPIFNKLNMGDIENLSGNMEDPIINNSYSNIPSLKSGTIPSSSTIPSLKSNQPNLFNGTFNPGEDPNVGNPLTEDINISPMSEVLRFAPIVANTLSSLKYQKLDPNKYKVQNRVTAPTVNINPLLADNRQGYASSLDLIKANSGGNAGTVLANLGAVNAGKYRADSKAYIDKFNLDSQNKFRADQMNLGLDQFNAESAYRTDDWNARSKEMSKNFQRKAAEQLGQYGEDKYQEAMGEAWVDAQSDNYDYNFTHKWKKKKYGGKLKK